MSKRLHCSLDNSSGLFSFEKKKEKKGKEEEAAYGAFIYFLTCPLHPFLHIPPSPAAMVLKPQTMFVGCFYWCWAVIFTITNQARLGSGWWGEGRDSR